MTRCLHARSTSSWRQDGPAPLVSCPYSHLDPPAGGRHAPLNGITAWQAAAPDFPSTRVTVHSAFPGYAQAYRTEPSERLLSPFPLDLDLFTGSSALPSPTGWQLQSATGQTLQRALAHQDGPTALRSRHVIPRPAHERLVTFPTTDLLGFYHHLRDSRGSSSRSVMTPLEPRDLPYSRWPSPHTRPLWPPAHREHATIFSPVPGMLVPEARPGSSTPRFGPSTPKRPSSSGAPQLRPPDGSMSISGPKGSSGVHLQDRFEVAGRPMAR